jgi:hypothetical protein
MVGGVTGGPGGGRDVDTAAKIPAWRDESQAYRVLVYRRTWMGHHGKPLPFVLVLVLGAGCPTVDLGDTPDEINTCNPAGGRDYFVSDIYPTYVKGDDPGNPKSCTQNRGCHADGDGNRPNFRIQAQRDDDFNFRQAQQFLECGNEETSLLLTKPLAGIEGHGGMDIFQNISEPEVQTFLDWF